MTANKTISWNAIKVFVRLVSFISLGEKHNVGVFLQNLEGWTALHEAACNGNVAVFQHLVHLGANIELVTAEGDTVLHKAARWGRTEVVALLLTVGADTNAVDQVAYLLGSCLPLNPNHNLP